MSKRYIDADKVMAEIERIGGHNLCEWETIGVKALIERQPTADVAEVRRGEWVVTERGCVITCSHCGERLEMCYPDGTEIRQLPYCPYCGAEMGGERKTDNEAVWDKNMEMLRSGGFGSMNGNECYETLLKYWKAQEEADFPMASENVKYFEEILGRKEQ